MNILAIESSCDETSAAILHIPKPCAPNSTPVEAAQKLDFYPLFEPCAPNSTPVLLSNVVVSQIDIFKSYGGVIPEIAARSHLEAILPVIDKAFSDGKLTKPDNSPDWDKIDYIAVTNTPGLLGSLLVGTLTARTLAILHKKPLYAIHHLKSHIFSNWLCEDSETKDNGGTASRFAMNLRHPAITFPLLALVISGGHTQIIRMTSETSFEIIGTTLDDAIGECFDKVAKILGLPYPGGPSISKAAEGILPLNILENSKKPKNSNDIQKSSSKPSKFGKITPGNPEKYPLPIPNIKNLDFSFSGLKTAVLRSVQKEVGVEISFPSHELKNLLTPEQICDFSASFEKTAVEILFKKLKKALKIYPDTKTIVFAGGVSANPRLREEAKKSLNSKNLTILFPNLEYAGDNAAMVAMATFHEISAGLPPTDPYSLSILPRSEIN